LNFFPIGIFFIEELFWENEMKQLANDIVTKLFVEFNMAIDKLRDLSQTPKNDFITNYEKVDAAKYNFIIVIEAMIDICSHIIADKNLGAPEEYADVFKIMGSKGVFPESYIMKLIEMTKFRNLLIHVYWKVHDDKIYKYLQNNLDDFDSFKKFIKAYLNSTVE